MVYGYARCSTNEKMQDITRQYRELEAMGVPKENIYSEYESGVKADRPEFNKLLKVVSSGDTICSLQPDRLTRSVTQLLKVLEISKEKGIKLVLGTFVVDFTKDVPDPMTLATVQLMGVFSELERNMISERVKSGMENARAKGKQIGRKVVTIEDIPQKFLKYYELYKLGKINKQMLSKLSEVSYPTCLKYCNMLKDQSK